jgi:AraC family transcriptional regulator of adaptative response/methylated-DNA-[protein]-cysteine methyltransferase
VITATSYGISGIGFADTEEDVDEAFEDLANRWPRARFTRDDRKIGPLAAQVFDPAKWNPDQPVRIVLIGTDFEVKVWETLLKIPCGKAATYSDVARRIGKPNANRAVGAAVGKNPISFVVPCHRVVGSNGNLTGYHWGLPRKRAILGWETGVAARA